MSAPEDQDLDGAMERLRADMEKGFSGLRAEIGAVRSEIGAVRSEIGAVRSEIGAVRTDMEKGFGALRAEMIDRDAALLKWFLVYAVTQTGVIAALLKLFR